jgi:hypothetical protein
MGKNERKYMPSNERWLMFFIRVAACDCRCRHCDFAVSAAYPSIAMPTIEGFLDPFVAARDAGMAPYGNLCAVMSDSPLNYPAFPEYAAYLKQHGIEGYVSFAANGFRFRTSEEWEPFLASLLRAGTEYLEFTFYGDREIHDEFAGRNGDFDAILSLASQWRALGGKINATSVMVHKKNLTVISELRHKLTEACKTPCVARLWSYLGHASKAEDLRIDEGDLSLLDNEAIECLGKIQPEREWVRELTGSTEKPYTPNAVVMHVAVDRGGNAIIPYTEPRLGLSGQPFDRLPTISPSTFVERWESTYQTWLGAMPSVGELAARFGDIHGAKLYDASIKRKWNQMSLLSK